MELLLALLVFVVVLAIIVYILRTFILTSVTDPNLRNVIMLIIGIIAIIVLLHYVLHLF